MKYVNRETLEQLGSKVRNAAQTGVARSKELAEIAKLKAANVSEEEAIKRAYIEIGKLYYAEHGEAPEGAYVSLCSKISKSRDQIHSNLEQIEELKSARVPAEEPAAEEVEAEEPAEEVPAEEPVEAEPAEEVPAEEPVEAEPAEEVPAEEPEAPVEE